MDVVRFGADVRLLRRRRGWTQARLAAEAKVARWVIVEIDTGRGARVTGRAADPASSDVIASAFQWVEQSTRILTSRVGYLNR
jgi:hypothetical protein